MNKPELQWSEVSALISTLGSEDNFARRLKDWREEKGWSLEQLSKELSKAESPLSISALHRMEHLDKSGSGKGRKRAISMADSLALCRVYEKSLVSALLPDEALQEHEGWVSILEAIEALERVQASWDDYRDRVQRVQETIWRYPDLQDYAAQVLGAAQAQFNAGHSQDWEKSRKRRIETAGDPVPGGADLAPYLDKQFPTLQIIAFSDALADQAVDKHGWVKRDRLRKVNGAADF